MHRFENLYLSNYMTEHWKKRERKKHKMISYVHVFKNSQYVRQPLTQIELYLKLISNKNLILKKRFALKPAWRIFFNINI